MTRELEMIDQIYRSIRTMIVIVLTLDMGRSHFLDHNRLVRQAVQRLWATVNRAESSNSTMSGLLMKSLPDLRMSIPSAVGQIGHEMPPILGQN